MVGKLWTGKAQSRKALREDRVGLDDIRRKTAHRVPEEPTSDRHPSRRLRASESEKQRTFRRGVRGARPELSVTLTHPRRAECGHRCQMRLWTFGTYTALDIGPRHQVHKRRVVTLVGSPSRVELELDVRLALLASQARTLFARYHSSNH